MPQGLEVQVLSPAQNKQAHVRMHCACIIFVAGGGLERRKAASGRRGRPESGSRDFLLKNTCDQVLSPAQNKQAHVRMHCACIIFVAGGGLENLLLFL